MAQLQDVTISLDHLVGVRRPKRHQSRNGTQRRQMFDRLVSRAVFSVAHGIVREYVENRQFHQRRKPNRWPGVIAEDEEGGAEGTYLRKRQSIDNRAHRMLADTKVEILTGRRARLEIASASIGQSGLI